MKGPKTLYVSDLDGTLLRRDQTVSPFTAETINTLTARGMPVPMGRPQQTGLSGALHSPAIDAVLAGIVLHNLTIRRSSLAGFIPPQAAYTTSVSKR